MGRLTKENKIDLLAFIILAGFMCAVVFYYRQAVYLRHGYPFSTFLFDPADRFRDFFNPLKSCKGLNPYFGFQATQYPFTNLVFHGFSWVSKWSDWAAFELFCLIVIGSFVAMNSLHLRSGNAYKDATTIFIFSFLTYPFLFMIERGNIEGLLFIVLLLFAHFFARGRFLVSAMFLSCAIAMKIFPVVLLALFLPERRYKEAIVSAVGAAGLTAASLAFFDGGFLANLDYVLRGTNAAHPILVAFTGGENFVQRGVSLLTFCKVLFIQYGDLSTVNMTTFLSTYIRIAALAAVLVAAYVWLIETALWRRVALLVFAMLLLPHVSADYKLIHLFVPILLFVDAEPEPGDAWYALLFGLLLVPKTYVLLEKVRSDGGGDITINILLNPVIMLVMSIMIIASGTRRWLRPSAIHVGAGDLVAAQGGSKRGAAAVRGCVE